MYSLIFVDWDVKPVLYDISVFHATNSLSHLIFQTFWVLLRWERLLTGYPSNHLRECSALPTAWASQRESSQRRAREGPSKICSSSCCSSGNGGAQPTQSNHWHYWLWAVGTTLKHCDWIQLVCFGFTVIFLLSERVTVLYVCYIIIVYYHWEHTFAPPKLLWCT